MSSNIGLTDSDWQCYTSVQHGNKVVGGFQRLWREKQMCDMTLLVQNQPIPVHRSFLAACSQYFYSMFLEGFKESQATQVELKGVTKQGLHTLLEYAYTGALKLNQDILQDVLEAAAHLQFTEVLDFCAEYINQKLTIANCLNFLKMADMYSLEASKQSTKTFILQNFVPVAQNEDFKSVAHDLLLEFLRDDRLRADSEVEVFNVALRWLGADPGRAVHGKSVLSLVRYGLISPDEMEVVYTNPLMLSEACRDILQSAIGYHMKLFEQPVKQSVVARMRAASRSLVILGAGRMDNRLTERIMAARLSEAELADFEPLDELNGKELRYFSAVAVIHDFVYVVGGQTAMAGDGSHSCNTAFRYNPRDGNWLQISSMSSPRTHFPLVALPTCMVAVGGKHNRVALNDGEMYNFQRNEWTPIASLPSTLFAHSGCAHQSAMFISGGCPGEDFTDNVHCYNMDLDAWQLKSPMNQSRGYHVMVTVGDKIYTCAGNTNAGDRVDVFNTEVYDIDTDQWTILSPMIVGQSEAAAVLCDDQIYVLGGYSWNNSNFQVTDIKLPEPMTGIIACNLRMPVKVFERFADPNG